VTANATVAQCKFSVKSDGTLAPSALRGELEKIKKLHADGLCDAYILITNLRVSGTTESWLRSELKLLGVEHGMVLDGNWISQQIRRSADLRRYVPRVYGLGDLGQILDDRRLQQADALMSRLGEDSAAELLQSWNPKEPDQLFWVDDAFGAIRQDAQLTDEWSRRLDQIMTAISLGAKVILTSRDYIYRQARPALKDYAYPLLREQAVVVDVAALSVAEKEQILYNHLKVGDQPASVLGLWKPWLRAFAASRDFQPELARRLSFKAFTAGIGAKSGSSILEFVEHPIQFLKDVLSQLETADLAAMACVYLSGDGIEIPLELTGRTSDAIAQMGSSKEAVIAAFQKLSGTFLSTSRAPDGVQSWRFRHPTIREAFASHIADDPNLVKVLLDGLSDEELFRQVDCGGAESGTLVNVPAALYPGIANRASLRRIDTSAHSSSPIPGFLERRCSDEFLRLWATSDPDQLERLLDFGSYMNAYWQPKLLGRLVQANALPESLRVQAAEKIAEMAIDDFDSDWLSPQITQIFTGAEVQALRERIQDETLPDLDHHIANSADGFDSDVPATQRYERAKETVAEYIGLFEDDEDLVARLTESLESIDQLIAESQEEEDPYDYSERRSLASDLLETSVLSERDPFEDVDAGHE
jgi:hypothetical protein